MLAHIHHLLEVHLNNKGDKIQSCIMKQNGHSVWKIQVFIRAVSGHGCMKGIQNAEEFE